MGFPTETSPVAVYQIGRWEKAYRYFQTPLTSRSLVALFYPLLSYVYWEAHMETVRILSLGLHKSGSLDRDTWFLFELYKDVGLYLETVYWEDTE